VDRARTAEIFGEVVGVLHLGGHLIDWRLDVSAEGAEVRLLGHIVDFFF
jgi:hypothetical protein